MPKAQFHIAKARRNEDFYQRQSLATSDFNEWSVVVLFYISMHYVDAVLSQDTSLSEYLREPRNHPIRHKAISKCSKLNQIAAMYLNLYDRGCDARYKTIHFPDGFLHKLETRSFKPMVNYLQRQLSLRP